MPFWCWLCGQAVGILALIERLPGDRWGQSLAGKIKDLPYGIGHVADMMREYRMAAPGRCQPCGEIIVLFQHLAVWHPPWAGLPRVAITVTNYGAITVTAYLTPKFHR